MDRYEGMTEREMLAIVLDRSERMEKAVFGNGQPGLITRVAALEERTPPSWERKAVKIGIPSVLVTLAITTARQYLGI